MLNLLDTDSRIQDLGSLDAELSKNKQKAGLAIKLLKRRKSAETPVKRNSHKIGNFKRKPPCVVTKIPGKFGGKSRCINSESFLPSSFKQFIVFASYNIQLPYLRDWPEFNTISSFFLRCKIPYRNAITGTTCPFCIGIHGY
jgi:hypothetical protein